MSTFFRRAPHHAPSSLLSGLRRGLLWIGLAAVLAACSGREDEDDDAGDGRTQAELARIGELRHAPGTTVFIAHLGFELRNYADLASVSYSIAPRPGTHAKPLSVSFDKSWLDRRGAWQAGSGRLDLPVFGLYAGHVNELALSARFRDGSRHDFRATIATQAYAGPARVYTAPDIRVARSPERVPGADFVLIKNGLTSPVVIDTDGHLRWTGAPLGDSLSTMFAGDSFYIGSQSDRVLYRMGLDGAYTAVPVGTTRYTNFHHELAPGKTGMLAELDAVEDGVARVESVLAEIDANGHVLKEWDLGRIFSTYMRSKGDNPANFVRDGQDWFHMNSAVYHAADNALLISSREHFVVKLDYDTGAIRWLFGDTGKHWYVNYPSLRALALELEAGKAPVGQHALSLRPDGQLLLFNNGLGSLNQPPGTPPGLSRSYSAPSRYAIDERAGSAREVWTDERGRALFSDICSSVYEGTPGNYLVAYSTAAARSSARLLGVDSQGRVAFDFAYPTTNCDTVFSAEPLAWHDLQLR